MIKRNHPAINYLLFGFLLATIIACISIPKGTSTSIKKENIRYHIAPISANGQSLLQVQLNFKPEQIGITKLHYQDQSWGQDSLFNVLSNFKLLDIEGTITTNRDSGWIVLKHPKNLESIRFQYYIHQDTDPPLISKNFYRPIIQKNYFHLFGPNLFVLPLQAVASETRLLNIDISWDNFPNDFVIHNSFGTQERQQTITNITYPDFQSAVFLGGDFRIHPITIKGNKVFFAIRGDWVKFDDATMLTILEQTFTVQRDFWQDHSQAYYTVTMMPTVHERGHSFQGTGLTNSFAMAASNNEYLELNGLVYLFNHELQHNWTGKVIKNQGEEQQYWFSEGFTDYYTWKNIAVNKIHGLGKDYFIQELNQCIINLYSSPVKDRPNKDINYANYWSSRDYQKLPYYRGAIFAFYLDNLIKQASEGQQSLDDLMRQFKKDAEEKGQTIEHAYFVKTASQFIGKDIKNVFNKCIEQGTLMDLEKIFPHFGLSFEPEAEIFDQGFQFSPERIVTAIDPLSNAFKAGLRLGDTLSGMDMYYGNTQLPVNLQVKKGEQRIDYSFMAVKKVPIPQIKNTLQNQQLLLGAYK